MGIVNVQRVLHIRLTCKAKIKPLEKLITLIFFYLQVDIICALTAETYNITRIEFTID